MRLPICPTSQAKRWPRLLFLGATSIFVGCRQPVAEKKGPLSPAVQVKGLQATLVTRPHTIRLSGSLKGEREASLAANTSGRIVETLVERGSLVESGAAIARIDAKIARINQSEAQANRRFAQLQAEKADKDCKRYEELGKRGDISKQEYELITSQCQTAREQVQAAVARAEQAEQTLSDGVIRAPFAGVVAERSVEVGQYVQVTTPVARLVETQRLRLVFTVPEAQINALKVGGEVMFGVSARKRQYTAKLQFLSPIIRESTRDAVAEAVYVNDANELWPGMFATVHFAVGEESVVSFPRQAAFEREGRCFVFVAKDGVAEQRVVSPTDLQSDPQLLTVERGVAAGDIVIASPPPTLQNGMKIEASL